MTGFNTEDGNNLVPRDEAMNQIKDKAREQGIRGAFKVFYAGEMVSTPTSMPAMVDMDLVRVSEMLDQASAGAMTLWGKLVWITTG